MGMNAKDIMTSRLVTVNPDTKVNEIAQLLLHWHISAVPVVDDDFSIIGIVSEGDLIHREEIGTADKIRSWWLDLVSDTSGMADEYTKSHGKTANDVMTRNVVTVTEDTGLTEIAELLEKHRIKRVPVVRDGRLVGIVSRANFIQRIAAAKDVRVVPVNANDDAIRNQVEEVLRAETWASIGTTNVTVSNGVVAFWGTAGTEAELKASRVAAESVTGVSGVEDHRAVQTVSSLSGI